MKITEKWLKENGFTYIKETDIFGHYFKCDKDGFGILIKWYYHDGEARYYVTWQSWIGNKFHKEKYSIPERRDGIFLAAETESFTHHEFSRIAIYIKENNDRMIKACKESVKKRLKKEAKNLIN